MTTAADRDRLIEKVRKCLALSKSPNENEAAAAMRQAQKLMQAYNITETDIGLIEYIDAHVDHPEYEYGAKKPVVIDAVVAVIMRAFSVHGVWESGFDQSLADAGSHNLKIWHRIRYFGRKPNVMIAVHTHTVVYRALLSAWRQFCRQNPRAKTIRNARASFAAGWCSAVINKIEDLRPQGDEKEKIEAKKAQRYGSDSLEKAKSGTKNFNMLIAAAGNQEGRNFSISRPVGTERNRLEKL